MRRIDEIILHCTATPEGRDVSVREVDAWHRARGWSGIGYHYLIDLAGEIREGRDVARVGAHVEGHNTGTIGVAYAGGLDAAGKTAKDTRTPAQDAAFARLLSELVERFGIATITGHNRYAAKACPCFDATKAYGHLAIGGAPARGRKPVGAVQPRDAILRRGDRGHGVDAWRSDMVRFCERLGVPVSFERLGPFGPELEAATYRFQALREIRQDGRVGPQTLDEMARALGGLPPFQALAGAPPSAPAIPAKPH